MCYIKCIDKKAIMLKNIEMCKYGKMQAIQV